MPGVVSSEYVFVCRVGLKLRTSRRFRLKTVCKNRKRKENSESIKEPETSVQGCQTFVRTIPVKNNLRPDNPAFTHKLIIHMF